MATVSEPTDQVKDAPAKDPTTALTLPPAVVERGITKAQWRTLFNLFPLAKPDMALLVWDYCKARNLDPMKKPCHIVTIDVQDPNGGYKKVQVVMPGIYEYRTTAHRTGLYLGHTRPEYGPETQIAGVLAPEYCDMTMLRWHRESNRVIEFPVQVKFAECVATRQDGSANARWRKAPQQMLTKCTEAAGLREAFPEEFGGEPTAEEMRGQLGGGTDFDTPPVVANAPMPAPTPRKSEQAKPATPVVDATVVDEPAAGAAGASAAAVPAAAAPASSSVQTKAPIGIVADVTERGGVSYVKLDTGFVCATKDPELIKAARAHKVGRETVDLRCRPSSDPTKYCPTLEEIAAPDEDE